MSPRLRGRIGYLPEERGLYQDMPILRTLTYFGVLQGMPARQATEAARGWLDRLGLDAHGAEKVKALSKGNQQKVQFVASILHAPPLAILDEPFSGLDPVNQNPDSTFARILGILPLTSSTVMSARVTLTDVPVWELLLSAALLVAGALVARRIAGKVVAIAMLMYGKEPSWGEIRRWVRES